MTTALHFRPLTAHTWNGPYNRVPVASTTFHIRLLGGEWWPVVDWTLGRDTASCPMVDAGPVRELAAAVNAIKTAAGAPPGGAFLINEHGAVLVPAWERQDAIVYLTGECAGPLRFHNPFDDDRPFDLYDDRSLKSGDSWHRPYVGLQYQLSRFDELYCWQESADGGIKLEPPGQDAAMIEALRRLRPWGAVRILVGPGGIVITKVPVGTTWRPVYVGRLNLDTWFPKEQLP
jgi:hypothetical protein